MKNMRFIKWCLACLATMTVGVAAAANTGSREQDAQVLSAPGTSESRRSVTLTAAYDPASGGYLSYGVYYYKVPLTKGRAYTIWVTDNGRVSWDVKTGQNSTIRSSLMSYTVNGISYKMIRANEWVSSDPSSCDFYVSFIGMSPNMSGGTLHMIQSDTIIPGGSSNPVPLAIPASGMVTNAYRMQGSSGAYHFTASLQKGRQYQFQTRFGSASNVAALSFVGTDSGDKLQPFSDGYDAGVDIVAGRTATYRLQVTGSGLDGGFGAITLAYGHSSAPMTDRSPAEHDLAGTLSPDERKTCAPGYQCVPSSGFTDEVIDECLFSFEAVAGRRYAFVTDSASVPLMAVIYDASGRVLAENHGKGDGSHDVVAAYAFDVAGTYYVGVCEDLEASGAQKPGYKTVGVTMRELEPDVDADKVTMLFPALTSGATVSPVSVDTSSQEPQFLSLGRWQNIFCIAGQKGFAYRFRAVTADGSVPPVGIRAEVFKGSLTGSPMATVGSASPEDKASGYLEFLADDNTL